MIFTSLPVSSHALVTLRALTPADIPVWFRYLTLPQVYEHTRWLPQSPSELTGMVAGAEPSTPSSRLRLAIALRTNDELVGTAGFHTVAPENRSAEIAYDLAPSAWGKGIATYACGLLTAWAHSDAGLNRVQATALESNARSRRVLERCGFRCEGLLRGYRLVRGTPGNFFMYSHLSDDAP